MNDADSTIFAIASGGGRAAIAVMRISGPAALAIIASLTRRPPPIPRRATLRRLLGADHEVLDKAIVLWMPGPASYTGEDCAELHLHGGIAVIDSVAAALITLGARPAEPGAFTRRAFLNGRIELTAAEGIADLIAAETDAQRIQALRQMEGDLERRFQDWARRLRACLVEQEAAIDFADAVGNFVADDAPLHRLIAEISEVLAGARGGERLRSGLRFAVMGAPNVGKSTLINALAGRDAAIVSAIAGTTRDVIEVRVVLGDVPVTLIDTAGLRDSTDPLETEGVRRARAAAETADLVIALEAADQESCGPSASGHLYVTSKIDLAPAHPGTLGVSVLSGAGLINLLDRLDAEARRLTLRDASAPLTRARHRAAALDASSHMQCAVMTNAPELRAEEVRLAMRALGRVTGTVGVEDVLDAVFLQFCIGK